MCQGQPGIGCLAVRQFKRWDAAFAQSLTKNAIVMKKVVLKWGRSVSSKIRKARLVRQSMAEHAVDFPNPDPSLQEIADKVEELEEAEAAAEQGGTDRTIVRDARLGELTGLMQREVAYVQLTTNGDPELVAKAGLDTQDEPTRKPRPGKVTELEANPGGNPGTVLLSATAPDNKGLFVFQRFVEFAVRPMPADGSAPVPSRIVEGYWDTIAVQGRGKLLVTGLVSGSHNRFRVAAANAAGLGDHSDEVTCVAR